jgi:hypothetical protein
MQERQLGPLKIMPKKLRVEYNTASRGWRIGYDPKPHPFGVLGNHKHLQIDTWLPGIKGSHHPWRIEEAVEQAGPTDVGGQLSHRATGAAVKVQGGKIVDRWSTLVNPGRPIIGNQMHGIKDADVKKAPKPAPAAEE